LDGEAEPPEMDLKGMLRPDRDERLRRAQALVRREGEALSDPEALRPFEVYLNVGHDNLNLKLMQWFAELGTVRIVLLHDMIPIDYPHYTREGTPEVFRLKLEAMIEADAIICNSAHTKKRLLSLKVQPPPHILVAPLGIEPIKDRLGDATGEFLYVGTIEPRKNHRLLLELWSALWERDGEAAPHLHIIGRRGWDIEDVVRTLNTHPMMNKIVHEHSDLPDAKVIGMLSTARALLFPSFAEGYGLPLAEALAVGCPVIASDLPALREVGGSVPDYLFPDDIAAWSDLVRAYAIHDSKARDAQLARLSDWSRPTWSAHFELVENLMETILAQ
jgi:glycosyltransferase involved in cell wall biosynthesis